MPGAFAHVTMAFTNTNQDPLLQCGFTPENAALIMDFSPWAELGAISPDMPYLVDFGGDEQSNAWADAMHHDYVCERIRAGIETVRVLDGEDRGKCLAWLLGFVSHVVFDVVMHPIVNKVAGGAYSPATKERHQECEMHQDIHIVKERLDVSDPGRGELIGTGIGEIHKSGDEDAIDPVIKSIFLNMLSATKPASLANEIPDVDAWYNAFTNMLYIVEDCEGLVSMARHVVPNRVYPKYAELKRTEFIDNLALPTSGVMGYSALFDRAQARVREYWGYIANSLQAGSDPVIASIAGWNLDTGLNANNKPVFWS